MSQTSAPPEADETGAWGPTVRGGRRRWGRWVARALLLLLVVPLVYGAAVGLYGLSRIERVAVDDLSGSRPLHILVTGSDSRQELSEEERLELSTGSAEGERTDTIFVLTVRGTRAGILAFPRDLFVERCDGTGGRINSAEQLGGPTCLVQSVEALSGISIDNYLSVSFLGFRDIVNAVGGVDLCLSAPIQDAAAGIDLPAGCQTLDGAQALGFVRVRRIDNDLERIKRQQQFLGALAQKLVSPRTLVDPIRTFRTAGEVGDALLADGGLGPVDLARLAVGLQGLATGRAVTATVPTTPATIGGAAVLLPVDGEAEQVFEGFRTGAVLDESGLPPPGEVTVDVLNGSGIDGAAGRTAEALADVGYTIDEVGNSDPVSATEIRYPPGSRPAAERLAQDLPAPADLVESDAVNDVTVVLGQELVDEGIG